MKTFLALTALFTLAAAQTEIYSGCGTVKGCVGDKEGCIDTQDCTLVQTWQQNSDSSFNFEVQGSETDAGNGNGWISVGWSEDTTMGHDLVVICNDRLDEATFWWTENYNATWRIPVELDPQPPGLYLGAIQAIGNDVLYCSFTRPAQVIFIDEDHGDEENIDLENEMYHAMAATGQTNDEGMPTKHTEEMVTDELVDYMSA